jgi:hypothetical protein
MPIALTNIHWKMYIINGAWDILYLISICVTWIETKGKTLEEIEEVISGRKGGHDEITDESIAIKGSNDYATGREL